MPTELQVGNSTNKYHYSNMQLIYSASIPLQIGQIFLPHEMYVVPKLVAPIIVGTDFLKKFNVCLDYKSDMVTIQGVNITSNVKTQVQRDQNSKSKRRQKRLWENSQQTAAIVSETGDEDVEECAIPRFVHPGKIILPQVDNPFKDTVEQYKNLFSSAPGQTIAIQHYIPTSANTKAARVPPRRIPAHYKDEVQQQLSEMLQQGIIRESSSPWLAPCVFVPKKNGEVRICVDYRELNKRTERDSYPLPLPDEVQDRLRRAQIFSKLDCRKGFWQVPVAPEDQAKTAFSPGPGMGLFEFLRMPFGLSGSSATFQRLMDRILRGLSLTMVYIDDVLLFSADVSEHREHLRQVLQRFQENGLTLHGEKCQIGVKEISYLGHTFSA
jgi:hypothetical protein